MKEFSTLHTQADAVASGQISPVALVRATLERIAFVQEKTNAFTYVFAEEALKRAEELEASPSPLGPLHGVPVAVKDLYDVAGVPTTGCTLAYAGRVATNDSAVVERLRRAGAIIVAKTNQHELAIGGSGLESSFGPVVNPWDAKRIPGGSSSGSAVAVATGSVALAMASDTAGSIRHPSSFCGVTGLKTGHGIVSRRGTMPLAPSLDTMGPIAADADDCLLAWMVVAGYDAADPHSREAGIVHETPDVTGMRIAIAKRFFTSLDAETRAAVMAAADVLAGLGLIVEEIDGPDPEEARRALGAIFVSEFADQYRDLWSDERLGPNAAQILAIGRAWSGADLASGHALAVEVRRQFAEAFERFDALLAPSTPHPAPLIDEAEIAIEDGTVPNSDVEYSRLAMPVNLSGAAALAFPVGFSSGGMPLGAQLIGRSGDEPALCALGAAYQSGTDWHRRHPPEF